MATLLDLADPHVRAAADAARRTFERIGARPFLERLDAATHLGSDGAPPAGAHVRASGKGAPALEDRRSSAGTAAS
jgi:hypothetical protein